MGSTSIDVPNVWSAVFARCCSESCSDTATPGHRGILVLQVPVSLKRLWGVTKRNISMLYASNKNSIYIIIICRFSLFLHSGKIKISKQRRHLFPFFRSEVLLFRHPNNHSTFIKQKEKGKDSEMESVSNSWVGGKYWMSDSLCEPENLWEMGRRAAISNNPVFSLSLSLTHTLWCDYSSDGELQFWPALSARLCNDFFSSITLYETIKDFPSWSNWESN